MMNSSSSCASGGQRALKAQQVVDQQVGGVVRAAVRGAARAGAARLGPASAPSGSASSAWLTSASAPAFCARGTDRIVQRSKSAQRSQRLRVQRLHVGVLDLVGAVDLLGDQLGVVDHLDLRGAERTARARARAAGRGTPRRCWSAVPMRSARLVEHVALGRGDHGGRRGGARIAACAAVHVDDDLHGHRGLGVGGERCEVAGHARAAPVADLAHGRRRRRPRGAPACGGRR